MVEPEHSWIDRAFGGGVAGAWRWDIQADEVTWSRSALEVLRDEDLGRTYAAFLQLVHPEDRDRVDATVLGSRSSGGRYSSEFRLAHDVERWIEARGHTVMDGERAVEMLGWLHDISTRKAAEDALVQLAEGVSGTQGGDFLWSLVEHLATVLGADFAFVGTFDPVSLRRVRSVTVWADGRRGENFEYDLDGTPCDEVLRGRACVHPGGVQQLFARDQLLADMGVDGYAATPMYGQTGELLGLLVVLWRGPIPDPRVAASALHIFGARAGAEFERQKIEARQRWGVELLARQQRALAELSRSPLWQTRDRNALLRKICELGAQTLATERISVWLFNADATQIVLVDLYEHSRDSHSQGLVVERDEALEYFLALEEDRVIAAADVRSDPRTRMLTQSYFVPHGIMSMLDAPIRLRGSTAGVICCEHVGVTREWLAEEESFVGSLADFASLAIDLDNRRALEEQLLQKQSLESIGRLAGGIAHDFNNLLTTISGSAELARIGLSRSQDIRQLLDDIRDSSQRAGELTSQLLGFARKRVIAPKVVDLNEVVRHADRMLERLIGEQVVLEVELEDPLWRVRLDPGQFEQILVNLALNGRDAMPEGGRLLIETTNQSLSHDYIRRHPELRSNEHVLLAVSDTGIGISKDALPRIFEPFYSTKPREQGTGLGLATCYGIVMQAGGQIYVYSEPGQGTTFKIYLPRTHEPLEPAAVKPEVRIRPDGDETLLLVEDDERVRRMAERGLQAFGYTVLVAATPSEALELVDTNADRIALVITDVIMPEMSGRSLASIISERLPETKALFVSGYTESSVVHHGVMEQGAYFLPKPFTPTILAAKVREVLDEEAHSS